ncbi:MAG: hypothetical protein ABIW82_13780 [Dokdonella sp.]
MRRNTMLTIGLAFAMSAPLTSAVENSPTAAGDTIFVYGFEDYVLTINNFLAWCTVSVNGGATTPNPPPTPFTPGAVVPLFGQPASAIFIWGYWRDTDVPGHDTNQTIAVTMTSDRTVFVCCPFTDGTGCPADPVR